MTNEMARRSAAPSSGGPSAYTPSVPDDWFVDPVRLGIPGLRPQVVDDDNPLSWQTDALCCLLYTSDAADE